MRWRLITAAATAALATAALGVAGVLAGDTDNGPGQDARGLNIQVADATRVDGPSGGAAARIAARPSKHAQKATKPQLIYLETDPLTLPPGPTGQIVQVCPGSSKAINGYYFAKGVGTGFGLVNEGDSPAGLRKWSFYLKNETTAPIANVTFGMICIKGVR
ncbi:MAG: hypothetical protein ACJ75R_02755 [Solirubrobacterales bacterium]